MEIADSLDKLSSKLQYIENKDLLRILISLETIISKTKDILTKSTPQHPPPTPKPCQTTSKPLSAKTSANLEAANTSPKVEDVLVYSPQALDNSLVARVHEHVKGLTYHPNPKSPNSPEIFLYGDQPYEYNLQSSEVPPVSIISSPVMFELLYAVNESLNTKYNSMLINKYKNIHSSLGPHKDDEISLDTSSPISALSLGATRRFQISPNEDKNAVLHTVHLASYSLCTMLPGFQEAFYHQIAPGRRSITKEKGVRYSVTFRHVVKPSSSSPNKKDNVEEENDEEEEIEIEEPSKEEAEDSMDNSPDTLVFGSSLTKGLDATLLSKHQKNFKVFPHSGARMRDLTTDIERESRNVKLNTSKVTSIFLVIGGNDIENLHDDADIENVYRDFENLVEVTKDVFQHAKINIISLIPRRARYKSHINNMYEMNSWLDNFCKENSCRFVNIFSHFLLKLPHIWLLNNDLFNTRRLHFNKVGNSVLAKVLIGVANNPR